MKKKSTLLAAIVVLSAILVLLLVLAYRIKDHYSDQGGNLSPSGGTTQTTPSPGSTTTSPSQTTPTQPSETDPTQPTQTEPTQPTETDPPPTSKPTEPVQTDPKPTDPLTGVGMYTREELENMSTDINPYGPGRNEPGVRPVYPQNDQSKYGQYGGNFIAPDNGNIYLTFDCGYEYTATDENGNQYRVTEKILDVLKEKNIKAVFFITMPYAKSQPDLVQRMIDEGHAVGNHSNNHLKMPEISIDEMIYEVMSLHEYVLENFGYEMHLFRPPTGAFSIQSLAVVQNLGYKNVHWSFAYADYDTANQPNYDYALDLVNRCHHSGAIYLLHAVSETNAAILAEAIDFFIAEGYSLERFS